MNVVAGSGCSFAGLRWSWSGKCLWLMRSKFAGLCAARGKANVMARSGCTLLDFASRS